MIVVGAPVLPGSGCVCVCLGGSLSDSGAFTNKVSWIMGVKTPIILGFLGGPEEAPLDSAPGWGLGRLSSRP